MKETLWDDNSTNCHPDRVHCILDDVFIIVEE
jgi:hypothetical protein